MGIRNNTWRSPLLLIDSWLPPSPKRTSLPGALPRTLQRFARAGWLGRSDAAESVQPIAAPPISRTPSRRPCRVRIASEGDSLLSGVPAARVVISGRIDDVCNELARLADLEIHAASPRC